MNSHDITWFRRNMAAQRFELLEDVDRERFERLLEENPLCRGFWTIFNRELDQRPADGHLPRVVIEHWFEAHRELAGPERVALREHLQGCEACRLELESRGFSGEMSAAPGEAVQIEREPAWGGLVRRGAEWVERLLDALPQGFSLQPTLVPAPVLRSGANVRSLVVDAAAPVLNLVLAPIHWGDADELEIRVHRGDDCLQTLRVSPADPPEDFLILNYLNDPPLAAGDYRFELRPRRSGLDLQDIIEERVLRIVHR
ncbi:MAG: zf-HC2 domain-containing protein [Calditrichaeota bacterium]|nr:zf-HC2 domain-containing protein [Calditrichota bacterium]